MLLVLKMPIGGGRGDADTARRLAEADGAGAVVGEHVARGGDQGGAQGAVMVG
jgi:hypothetical protein